jgi:CHAD domain-containing protein
MVTAPATKPPMKQAPPLRGTMTCDRTFQAAATHYLHQLTAQQKGTSAGEAPALHAMRVALTRLRTTIAFFAPMVAGAEQIRLAAELKWLNAHLGIVRDLDVALDRLAKIKPHASVKDQPWKRERAACQRHLTRALRSPRYRRLIRDIAAWIENGDWSRKRTKNAAERRAQPAEEYCSDRLKAWRKKLLKKSRKLQEVGARKRHRVRLANKRLSYAIEATETLVLSGETPAMKAMLRLLRKTHKSLGELNDDARFRALAAALGEDRVDGSDLALQPKQKKRLLRKAVNAYEEFAALEPLKISSA